jgi:hypothetical protein
VAFVQQKRTVEEDLCAIVQVRDQETFESQHARQGIVFQLLSRRCEWCEFDALAMGVAVTTPRCTSLLNDPASFLVLWTSRASIFLFEVIVAFLAKTKEKQFISR